MLHPCFSLVLPFLSYLMRLSCTVMPHVTNHPKKF
uniref:Uncharacterized protein n=1 Tax=Arundo donax TaxID=35708 RepID=A0A0A9FFT8_ARUDO